MDKSISGGYFTTSQGGVYVSLFNPEGINVEQINTYYDGFYTTDEIFEKYYEDSMFQQAGLSEKYLRGEVLKFKQELPSRGGFRDNNVTPLTDYTVHDGAISHMGFYGRKYSFNKAMQRVWVALPTHVKEELLVVNKHMADKLLCGGFGVQGLIHTADNKLLTTLRSRKTINNGGLIINSFNEGASTVDVENNTVNIVNMFRRGTQEELNIKELTNVPFAIHTFMLDVRLYEWDLFAYVDATKTSLTSHKILENLPEGVDAWEHETIMFNDFTAETIKNFIDNQSAWVSHSIIGAGLTGTMKYPELATYFNETFNYK